MKIKLLDKIGAIGSILAAAACPVCFPVLGIVGSAIGLGVLKPYEGIMMKAFLALVLLALIGNILSFLNHKKLLPLIIGIISPALIYYAFLVRFIRIFIYIGLIGMLVSAVLNYIENRKCDCKIKGDK